MWVTGHNYYYIKKMSKRNHDHIKNAASVVILPHCNFFHTWTALLSRWAPTLYLLKLFNYPVKDITPEMHIHKIVIVRNDIYIWLFYANDHFNFQNLFYSFCASVISNVSWVWLMWDLNNASWSGTDVKYRLGQSITSCTFFMLKESPLNY